MIRSRVLVVCFSSLVLFVVAAHANDDTGTTETDPTINTAEQSDVDSVKKEDEAQKSQTDESQSAADQADNGAALAPSNQGPGDQGLSDHQGIIRQIMSKSGVLLDMATLTDNGYRWTNDVVWEGSDLIANQTWHTAGFLFEREGYKGVWLQYAFTLANVDDSAGAANEIGSVQRWYGDTGFR